MIPRSQYRFIDVPKRVDLSRKLMPKRGEAEQDWFYGVDPAWLGEVLSVWSWLYGYSWDGTKKKMPKYPAIAEYHNWLRFKAFGLTGSGKNLYHEVPDSSFNQMTDLHPIPFDFPPQDVKIGDPLRKDDIMDLYRWMKDVRAVEMTGFNMTTSINLSTTHGDEGDRSWQDLPTPSGTALYSWNWIYTELHGGAWPDEAGGAWRRDEGSATITARVKGRVEWFKSARMFVQCVYSYPNGQTWIQEYKWVLGLPCTFEQYDENQIVVHGGVSSDAARQAFGEIQDEKEYKTDMTRTDYPEGGYAINGSDHRVISINNPSCSVFLTFADDYTPPAVS